MAADEHERVPLGSGEAVLRRGEADGLAIIVPGAGYPVSAPLLWFGRETVLARGWSVLELDLPGPGDATPGLVGEAICRFGDVRLVIAKSEGSSSVIPAAVDAGLGAVWLTPPLDDPVVAAALERSRAPTLIVGATGDPTWSVQMAARLRRAEVLQLGGVDHRLQAPGRPMRSLEILERVVDRIQALVDRL